MILSRLNWKRPSGKQALGQEQFKEQLEIVPADQVIGMDEEPVMAPAAEKERLYRGGHTIGA